MYVLNGAHVQAPGGLDGDEQLRVLVNLPGDDGLLLVAAGHAPGRRNGALAGTDVVLLNEAHGVLPDGLPFQKARRGDEVALKIPLEHHVVLQGVVQNQAVLVPVLGDVAHAGGIPLADGGLGDVLAAQGQRALLQGFQAGDAVDQLRLAVAVDARDADDFAPADLEGHVLDGVVFVPLGGHGHALHVQHHLAGLGGGLFHHEVHVPAHHHPAQLLLGAGGDVHGADVLALAQHGTAVGHGHDFVELVGDKQDALPLGGEVFHNLHQLVDLLGGQHGGGLVENQDLVLPVQHLQNLGALLHAHGDVLHQGVRVHMKAVLLREGQHLLPGLSLLEEAVLAGLHAHDDVVQHRKALHQLEVLVDHADP